jgi:hypothetical protein
MTARSGDALSHVNFQVRQTAVLTESQGTRILSPGTGSDPQYPQQANGSCRICMAAMRRHRGTNPAGLLHLLITCLNLLAPADNCIRK